VNAMICASQPALNAEWERIYCLALAAEGSRRGKALASEQEDRLKKLQGAVLQGRASEPWLGLHRDFGLVPTDLDIIVCALAPEAEPRLGWLFRELQAGTASPYPSPALISELFALELPEYQRLQERLDANAPLRAHRLVDWGRDDSYEPIRATEMVQMRVLGRTKVAQTIPGAVRIVPRGRLQDLVIPEASMCRLRQLALWRRHREQVEKLGIRVPGGPIALFSGPSGTGKTFAAEALAQELGLALYRVDLGLLVSKYIGETEKNLNALFESATRIDCLLLFDEADSLFGKRGEVREARDRYANMEVSHLLSRIERHGGPCVLTSNLRQHIDAAFTRRFDFIIEFPRPDAQARRQLWERFLPPAARGKGIDVQLLAESVDLTGAQIEKAARHAAFVAAAAGTRVTYVHLVDGLTNELSKQRAEVLPASLGALARYVQQVAAERGSQ
jgi:hypothetical protein